MLDLHTIRSEFIGYDEFGHERFQTERTGLGELVYKFKYCSDRSALEPIVRVAFRFIRTWSPPVDAIIPTPPSSSTRQYQPVLEFCRALSRRMGVPLLATALTKIKPTPQVKDVQEHARRPNLLAHAFAVNAAALRGRSVLLIDDVYDSSSALNAITQTLYSRGAVKDVFALVLTRTRRLR